MLATGASPAPSAGVRERKVVGPYRIRVAVPRPGDINLTVVPLRGRSPQTTIANLRRLPSSVSVFTGTRLPAKGRPAQQWFSVVNRSTGSSYRSTGSSSGTGAADRVATFVVRGATPLPPFQTFSSLTAWPEAPPAGLCRRGNTPVRPSLVSIRGWNARFADKLLPAVGRAFARIVTDTLCDVPADALELRKLGIFASDFTLRRNSPTEVGVTGTISEASTGLVLTPVPDGIVALGGKDGPTCRSGSRGTELIVGCGGNRFADDPLDLILTFLSVFSGESLDTMRSTYFDSMGRQRGPFEVQVKDF